MKTLLIFLLFSSLVYSQNETTDGYYITLHFNSQNDWDSVTRQSRNNSMWLPSCSGDSLVFNGQYNECIGNNISPNKISNWYKIALINEDTAIEKVALHLTGGYLVNASTGGVLRFPKLAKDFYIRIQGRNTVGTWSAKKYEHTLNWISDSFDAPESVYGKNLFNQNGTWLIFTGEIDGNKYVDLTDVIYVWNRMYIPGWKRSDIISSNFTDHVDSVFVVENWLAFVTERVPPNVAWKEDQRDNIIALPPYTLSLKILSDNLFQIYINGNFKLGTCMFSLYSSYGVSNLNIVNSIVPMVINHGNQSINIFMITSGVQLKGQTLLCTVSGNRLLKSKWNNVNTQLSTVMLMNYDTTKINQTYEITNSNNHYPK